MDQTSDAWVHDLDPVLVELPGTLAIRWYGLAYLAGFFLAWLLVRQVLRRGRSPLGEQDAGNLVVTLALGAVVGARLGYAVLYQPSLLWTVDGDFPFWRLLALHEGGMASHGGMVGALVAAALFAWRRGVPFLFVADLAAFGAPAGLFLGRLANFVNGELYGRPASGDLPWAVRFPQELWALDHARLGAALEAAAPHVEEPVSVPVVIAAIQRGNDAVAQAVAPYLTARHPSQLYEALLEGALLLLLLAVVWTRPRRPGTVAGVFAIGYGIVRVVVEGFREPDAHIAHLEYAALQITRGQWLSLLLVLAGVVVLALARRREGEPLGGWRQRPGTGTSQVAPTPTKTGA